jgi:Cu2+-containing amine oxidase
MKNRILLLSGLALAALGAPATAKAQCSAPYNVEQSFPTAGPEQTRWKICWQVMNGPNLVITGAWFRPAPAAAWIKILYDARVSQLFVPYHPQGGWRYYDIGYNFGSVPLTGSDCLAPNGTVLGNAKEVCKEVRDRGLAWKHDASLRRGQELVVWSVMAAANYNYIVEWSFRDDGIIVGRVGATGQIAGPPTHVHGPIWRLDVDLNGFCCNTVSSLTHTEVGLTGVDSHTDIAAESGMTLKPTEFSMMAVRDQTLVNGNGKHSEWHLMPNIAGTPLHQEPFTKNTFWVSHYKWSEMLGDQLPAYIAPAENVANSDIVLWYYGGLHHVVRDEDSNMTHLMWLGFMLKPNNVWATTPLFP